MKDKPDISQTTLSEVCLTVSGTLVVFSVAVPVAFIVLGALHVI